MRIPPCDVAPIEFCTLFKIKADIWRELQERGLAPKVHRHPGTDLERISPTAIREWQEAVKDPDCEAAKILRRYALARRSGLASLKSPDHPANLLRALKAARKSAVG